MCMVCMALVTAKVLRVRSQLALHNDEIKTRNVWCTTEWPKPLLRQSAAQNASPKPSPKLLVFRMRQMRSRFLWFCEKIFRLPFKLFWLYSILSAVWSRAPRIFRRNHMLRDYPCVKWTWNWFVRSKLIREWREISCKLSPRAEKSDPNFRLISGFLPSKKMVNGA